MTTGTNRFDPYDSERWGCFCPLCMELARVACTHIPSAVNAASDALYLALTEGRHRKQGPKVSLTKERTVGRPVPRRHQWSHPDSALGIGIGNPW